jgi:hypothetical protein
MMDRKDLMDDPVDLKASVPDVNIANIHKQIGHNLGRVSPIALPPDSVPTWPRLGRETTHRLDQLV